MKLYFKKPQTKNASASVKMVVDLDKKTIEKGCYITSHTCVQIKSSDFDEMYNDFKSNGFIDKVKL